MGKPMTPREQFFADVLITAIEGGINYWAQIDKYDTGMRDGHPDVPPSAVVCEVIDEAPVAAYGPPTALTIQKIRHAFGVILAKDNPLKLEAPWRKQMVAAFWANDGGDVDSGDADCVVQIALLGEIRYA